MVVAKNKTEYTSHYHILSVSTLFDRRYKMGCGGSKQNVDIPYKPAHVEVTSVDQAKLAEMTLQREERDEARLQNEASVKMAEKEKEANEAAAQSIAHQISASLAEKEIQKVGQRTISGDLYLMLLLQ